MSVTLVQTVIKSGIMSLVFQCDKANQLVTLWTWLTAQGVLWAESVDDINGPGMWCAANDPSNTAFTLIQAVALEEGGWITNNVGYLNFCDSLPRLA